MMMCERHGGPWGEDITCVRCTDSDGNPRDEPEAPVVTEADIEWLNRHGC